MDFDDPRFQDLCKIVMDLLLHDPAFEDKGDVIGEGVNEISARDFVSKVLEIARTKMRMTLSELSDLIGSFCF